MIERIVIKDVATFDNSEHVMENLGKLNFIFGSNGSGKTTISRVLKTPEKYTSCSLSWEGNMQIERRVYNSDFVEANFVPEEGMPGIFTLGQEESDTKKKIKDLREQLTKLKEEKKKTEVLLYGEDQAKGKTEELKSFKESCIEKIWQLTQNYRNGAIREGLTGYLKKEKFFTKVLEQYKAKRIKPDEYDELEKKATVIFQGNHEKLEEIPMVNFSSVQRLNNEQILSKKIIGKEDVDIGTLIKKLGNSDWIKDGMKYLDVSEGVCPFCQKTLQDGFYAQIEEYFDETYSADLKKIDTLRNNYQNESNNLVEQINKILQRGSDKINNTELQNTIATLLEIFKLNNKKIEDKIRTPSIPIELEGYQGIPEKVAALITTANKEIEKHNAMVANLADEKEKLKREIWQAIVQEVESEIVEYNREVQEREKEISDLHQQNEKHTRDIQRSKEDLQNLQIKLTSVIPMKDKINQWLEQFGFMGFRLDCGDDEHSYKIIRENGSPAEKTLSEGERNLGECIINCVSRKTA